MKTVGVTGVSGFLVKNGLLQCFFEMATLQCKLLEPTEKSKFITSDHPVICMNQLFGEEAETSNRSYSGFSRSGFQLILPITPVLCLFFYDPKVYKVGNKRDNLVGLNDKDVELVNSLQVQNAGQCLYSSEQDSLLMEGLVDRFGRLRKPTSDLLQVKQTSDSADMYHVRSPNPKLQQLWSFCQLQRSPRVPDSRRRNPAWTDVVQAFAQHSDGMKSQDLMGDFARFVENYVTRPF
jgi:hypothetical protein